ncbi:FIST N-terminal domain-containing protein [Primorskyibacter sp. S187A]|uniref:FIST N-terminal domain-containing protein n=1 Tax=Primorskyibacter sp. S187A TaxID=3415130 RepID=UPI003C7976C2
MGGETDPLVRRAQVWIEHSNPIGSIAASLGEGPFEIVWLFISARADFDALAAEAHARLTAKHVVACTTAGEIGEAGYEDDQIVALALPQTNFRVSAYAIDDLTRFNRQAETDRLITARIALTETARDFPHPFAFLLVDGLSQREDVLTAVLASGLGGMPLFGGSSGDGIRFKQTRISLDGQIMDSAAVVSLVASRGPVEVFSLNHLHPTGTKMVVTDADPAHRIVRQINAEPAAAEYARLVGKAPGELDQFTFAAHPVVVQLGGRHHVRAIQQVSEDGSLIFFSAIDEGMVLTLAESEDMASHLDRELSQLAVQQAPEAVLSCDCILRRLEAGQKQQMRDVSAILAEHKAIGFGTYGEQHGALHVNHTMTGVAFYAPQPTPAEHS